MNSNIIENISKNLNISVSSVENTLKLLEEGNTIPFISRYRKEITGGLDEDIIKSINEVYEYECNLLKRKEDVIRLIDEKGLLTDDIKNNILASTKLVEVEDIYRPYKEKKKTKATEAIKAGLEPLAKIMMSFKEIKDIDKLINSYLNEQVPDRESAIAGAKYIIAEWISDNANIRKNIRRITYINGNIVSKIKKNAIDESKTFEMYYEYTEPIKTIKSHRILALNRGEDKNILQVSVDIDENLIYNYMFDKILKNKTIFYDMIIEAIKDSYKRLIGPSIEREIRSDLKEKADLDAIDNFSKNLESLLLQPPIKDSIVLAFDPGYVNGCKLAVIDQTGKYITSLVIKPFTSESNLLYSKKVLLDLINKYKIDVVALGNGTASRESEKLIADIIRENKLNTKYVIVSEAGASIYSTEKIASDEFPNLSPNERSAVSIGRRLQDPLSELVKIPPDGIGVGMYQHDVKQSILKDKLDFVVTKVVNNVGVNINTASPSLLKYVSGINKLNINKIIDYRDSYGKFSSREELLKKKILTPKSYEQAIGFLRITDGTNILDSTSIHPESYEVTTKLIEMLGFTLNDIGSVSLSNELDKLDISRYTNILNVDKYTLEDIILSLKKPNRDPRDEIEAPILRSDILDTKDLRIGMHLKGTVRNVIDFGAFIDIGLHNDALVHISKITDKYIKHPSDVLTVGDIVDCYVLDIKNDKVSLTLIKDR